MKSTARVFAAGLLLALPNLALTSALAARDMAPETTQEPAEQTPLEAVDEAEPVWAFEMSDVEVDPGFVFGQLDNGMRYILRQNGTPEGTALVRMRIDSGSLEETDEERGLSHYLEHMAFNGSTNIPEGEMVKLLEREGLAFGAGTNASTGLEAITYMLNLPRNDDDLLDTALMIMRETASELTLAEDAVERERGVILSEERDRRNFQQKALIDTFDFLAPDARFPQRLPIGTVEVIENATSQQLRNIYERTYTPENTTLVIVGDYDVEVMEAKVKERFTDWTGLTAPGDKPTGPVDTTRMGETDIYLDPALSESVSILRMSPWEDRPDTLASREARTLRGVGYGIIGRRLARLARGEDAPYLAANYSSNDLFEDARLTEVTVSSADGEWKKGVLAAVREINEALTFGFTQAEVDEQLANIRTSLDNAVNAADTRTNGAYVGSALNLVGSERIPTAPAYRKQLFESVEPKVTPESVLAALRADIAPLENPLIRFQGRTAPEGGKEALRTAFTEAMALPIAAPEDTGPAQFAYTDFGTPGEVVEDSVEERLGIRRVRFANGVRLNIKKTDVREGRIIVRVSLDGGNLMATKDDPLKVVLASLLTVGGLGEHSVDDLQTVLAGKSVSYAVTPATDAFRLGGSTTPRDLQLQMNVLTAFLTDPGYRPEGVERFRKGIESYFESYDATPGGALGAQAEGILSGGDPRFVFPSLEDFLALDYEKLSAAIGDRLAKGAIEVAVVGDLDEDAAIAAVASTLGALPEREADFLPREEARIRTFTETRGVVDISHKGEPDQALLRHYWPTTDNSDHAEALKLMMLARIMRLELTSRIREDLGQAYSPTASASSSRYYPKWGNVFVNVSAEVEQIVPLREAIDGMVEALRGDAIDDDLLTRARQPWLDGYENRLKSLGGWMALASRAQSEADRLDRHFEAPEIVKALTPEDMRAVAQKYLKPGSAVEFIVTPEPPKTCVSPDGTGCGAPAPAPIEPSAPATMNE